ncbi:hypothetical protein BC828DRAFT_375552 [Blastocladiella britannica]|nr:hypothetical protein BC828DRAFT_375552 [Blastocladiella britannica]
MSMSDSPMPSTTVPTVLRRRGSRSGPIPSPPPSPSKSRRGSVQLKAASTPQKSAKYRLLAIIAASLTLTGILVGMTLWIDQEALGTPGLLRVQLPEATSQQLNELVAAVSRLEAQNADLRALVLDTTTKAATSPAAVDQQHVYQTRFDSMEDDFDAHLMVQPVHHLEVDPEIQALVDAHDITTDATYVEDPEEMDWRVRRYGAAVERGSKGDKRFFVQFTDAVRGYGLFAKVPIRKGDILGSYAGLLTNNSFTTDYVWTYLSDIRDPATGEVLDLSIDAKVRGNWFRYANDGPAYELNAQPVYVPYKNKWHVVYVAGRAINAGQEILISYGESYWASRTMLDTQGDRVGNVPADENNAADDMDLD